MIEEFLCRTGMRITQLEDQEMIESGMFELEI